MIRLALVFYLLFQFLFSPFYLIPVSFSFLLSHREAGCAGTVERGGLGAPYRRGTDRNKGWGGSTGRGGVGCLVSGWGADVCVGAGRRGGHRADQIGEGETKAGRAWGLCSIGSGAITE